MDEGDIYHWCDVGCHLNINGIHRLKEYIEIIKNDNSLTNWGNHGCGGFFTKGVNKNTRS